VIHGQVRSAAGAARRENRKGPGDATQGRDRSDVAQKDERDRNLDQQGRQGNIRENTRNQGYQQDR
jgi:hypothetical protein